MDIEEENDKNISFCEEPRISYYSSSLNLGVASIFSERNSRSYQEFNFTFTPTNSSNNNKFSLCNTIMLPSITTELSLDEDKNNNIYNNNSRNHKNNSCIMPRDKNLLLKKDNTTFKTDTSKDEKNNISDDKQLTNILIGKKESNNTLDDKKNNALLEENPFFLGKTFTLNNFNNIKPLKSSSKVLDVSKIENRFNKKAGNNDNENEFEGFLNRDQCKSYICCDNMKNGKRSSMAMDNDDKSENLIKKKKKMSTKNAFLNSQMEFNKKTFHIRQFKRKITFNMDKNITKEKEKNKTMEKDREKNNTIDRDKINTIDKEKDKEDSIKLRKSKGKKKNRTDSNTNLKYKMPKNKRKSFYFSNKCVTNAYNINNINTINTVSKKNKIDNESLDEKEKNSDKKNSIKKNNFKLRTQKKESKLINKAKDESKKASKNKISNKYKTYHKPKGITSLKEYIKIKDRENKNDNSRDKSWNLEKEKDKKIEVKNTRYNSKKELKTVILKRKDSDSEKKEKKKEKIKRGRTILAEDENESKENIKEKKTFDKKNMDEKDKERDRDRDKEKNKEEKSKKKYSNKLLLFKEKEKDKDKDRGNDSENNKSKINKCLTADLSRKKNFTIFDKSEKGKTSNSSKKKISITGSMVMNLFGNDIKKKKKKNSIDFEFALKNNLKKMQFNFFSKDKFTNTEFNDSDYLKYTLDCMELILDIDIEKQTRLKNKINFNFPKSKKNKIKKKIALFDLDETLVHCTGDIKNQKEKYQHKIEIKLPGKQAVEVGINLRPYWKQTLNLIKKKYYIVIYTASHQAYADSVLDFMDPKKKYFKYRLYRNNCSLIDVDGAKFYVKDLDIFNEYYDLKDIVIIDNSVLSFAYHLHNGIPIVPYYDEDKDGSLYVVGLYLLHIFHEEDLREANKKQINLDSFLEEAKKNKDLEEEYVDENKIDEESDSKEDDNNDSNKENNDGNNKEIDNNKKSFEKKISKKSVEQDNKISEIDKKKSDKKLGVKKKSSNFLCSLDHRREQENDFTQRKLMSQSKLINMYYEVKDKSPKSEHINEPPKTKLNNENRNSLDNENLASVKKKNNDNEAKIIFVDNDNDDLDCKSDPGFAPNEPNFSDNDSSDKENPKDEPVLMRLYTIYNDASCEKRRDSTAGKDNSRTKLGFIRSNFYNNFKI